MATFYDILVIVHILCWVAVLVSFLIRFRAPRIVPGQAHSVAAALVTGIALTGIASASDAVADPNNVKVAVKLLIALAATVLAYREQRKPAPNRLAYVLIGLVLVNVVLAFAW